MSPLATNPAPLDRTVEEFRRTLAEIGGQPSSPDDAEILGRRAAMIVLAGSAQFDAANNAPFAVIKKLNEIFDERGLDPWTLAAFATAPQPELDDRAPVEAFADTDLEPLLLAARRTVADLTR